MVKTKRILKLIDEMEWSLQKTFSMVVDDDG